ncbi:MAG: tetraacyldisaccharide 4'-kinase [Candidatus Gastranaerophilales bacterium]|nr:tetraacyldisaccharide 4'-kinase [Candidatus Gastranaerophilales bacterium]
MKEFFNSLHYKKTYTNKEKALLIALKPFSLAYLGIIKTRNFLYNKGILKTTYLPAYTISIGNLTTGGTGKTPITAKIANYIKNNLNKEVSILSRGYGGDLSTSKINIISDGKNIFHSADMAGDEPYWFATNTKEIPIITGKNRIKSGSTAVEKFNSEIIVLDDGFQHLKLGRHLNILVIDCHKWFGNDNLLPQGPLREPLEQIKRADKIILMNKLPLTFETERTINKYKEIFEEKYQKPVFICNMKPFRIYDIQDFNTPVDIQKIGAFTAIAQPEYFFKTLENTNAQLMYTKTFADHYLYTKENIENLIAEALKNGAEALITTEKDAVKVCGILKEINIKIPVFTLKMHIDLDVENLLKELK